MAIGKKELYGKREPAMQATPLVWVDVVMQDDDFVMSPNWQAHVRAGKTYRVPKPTADLLIAQGKAVLKPDPIKRTVIQPIAGGHPGILSGGPLNTAPSNNPSASTAGATVAAQSGLPAAGRPGGSAS